MKITTAVFMGGVKIANTLCSQLFILHLKEKALIHGTYLEIGKIVAILGDSRL